MKKTPNPVSLSLYVDRIEEGLAVLIVGGDDQNGDESGQEINFPVKQLPAGTDEGDWLTCVLTPAPEKKSQVRQQNADLMAELLSPPDKKE